MAEPDFEAKTAFNRIRRMNTVDTLTKEHRELVHEYGTTVVFAFLQIRVTEPRHIRHLVETVLNEFSPTRGSSSNQGVKRADGWKSEAN